MGTCRCVASRSKNAYKQLVVPQFLRYILDLVLGRNVSVLDLYSLLLPPPLLLLVLVQNRQGSKQTTREEWHDTYRFRPYCAICMTASRGKIIGAADHLPPFDLAFPADLQQNQWHNVCELMNRGKLRESIPKLGEKL